MSRTDDLTLLIDPRQATPGLGYRQGVVIAWNQETAENIVAVGGTSMINLPALNTSEASLLVPGDVVGVMTSGSSWVILGRLIIPGTPEAASSIKSITNRIVAANDDNNGTRNSTVWGDLTGADPGPAVTVKVGSAGRVLALWSCELGQMTDGSGNLVSATKTTPHVGIELSGANTAAADAFNALNLNLEFPVSPTTGNALAKFWVQAAMMRLYTGLTPGDTTFTMKYRHDGVTPSNDINFNAREIACFVL